MNRLRRRLAANRLLRLMWDRCYAPIYIWFCSQKPVRDWLAPHFRHEPYRFLYSHRGTGLGADQEARRLRRSCSLRGGRVLFLGVQKGNELRDWLSSGLDELIAIDIEAFPKEWEEIRHESQENGTRLHFAVMDAQRLALNPSSRFDLIYSQGLLEHIVDVEAFLRQCVSLLKPSGRFYAYLGPLWRSYGGSTHLGMLGYDHLMVTWDEYLRYAKLVGDGWEYWAEKGLYCRLSWNEIRELIEKYFEFERIALLGGRDCRWFRQTYPSKWQRLLEKYPEKDLNFRLASVTARRRRIVSETA